MRSQTLNKQPWARVLYGLGIRHVGSVNAQLLTENYPTVEELMAADGDAIATIHGIGPEIAESVHAWFQSPNNQSLIQRLQTAGLQFTAQLLPSNSLQTLSGMTFVVTGTLPTLKRDQAKQLIQDAGGKVMGSVSKNTSYIVVGEEAGSKLAKAQSLGINQLSEADLLDLLEPS